jgi:hypothetical protein
VHGLSAQADDPHRSQLVAQAQDPSLTGAPALN